ncbi:hypothetical protein JCM1841_003885 [Sporobolomyces salmonicolor]
MAPTSAASSTPTPNQQQGVKGGKAPKKAIKGNKSRAGGDNKRKKKCKEAYSSYIYKVFKQVHPDTGISNKAMLIRNSFVNDIF